MASNISLTAKALTTVVPPCAKATGFPNCVPHETSLDKMPEIARRKKLTEPPKWVIPDDF